MQIGRKKNIPSESKDEKNLRSGKMSRYGKRNDGYDYEVDENDDYDLAVDDNDNFDI